MELTERERDLLAEMLFRISIDPRNREHLGMQAETTAEEGLTLLRKVIDHLENPGPND